jgi:hypothetical protein
VLISCIFVGLETGSTVLEREREEDFRGYRYHLTSSLRNYAQGYDEIGYYLQYVSKYSTVLDIYSIYFWQMSFATPEEVRTRFLVISSRKHPQQQ